MTTVEKGRKGESLAAEYLNNNGYSIIWRNFRAFGGEIDIVAVRGCVTVFAEIKYWDVFGFREIGNALDRRKCERIIRASKGFLKMYPVFTKTDIRYDVLYADKSGTRRFTSST